jgi:hypothetical protein
MPYCPEKTKMKQRTRTVFDAIRRLWRAFARGLPEYKKHNLREWRYWGTLRAKRELGSLGLEWKELVPPGKEADKRLHDHDQPEFSNRRAEPSREVGDANRPNVTE